MAVRCDPCESIGMGLGSLLVSGVPVGVGGFAAAPTGKLCSRGDFNRYLPFRAGIEGSGSRKNLSLPCGDLP